MSDVEETAEAPVDAPQPTKAKATKKHKGASKYASYTPAKRVSLLKKYEALRKKGMAGIPAAKSVGVSYLTIKAWQKKTEAVNPTKAAKTMRQKPSTRNTPRRARNTPVAKPSRSSLRMTFPMGATIEGLTVEDVLQLIQKML